MRKPGASVQPVCFNTTGHVQVVCATCDRTITRDAVALIDWIASLPADGPTP